MRAVRPHPKYAQSALTTDSLPPYPPVTFLSHGLTDKALEARSLSEAPTHCIVGTVASPWDKTYSCYGNRQTSTSLTVEQGLVSEENGACWIHKARDSSPLVERWIHERMAAGVRYPAGAAGELISLELTFCADSWSVSLIPPY